MLGSWKEVSMLVGLLAACVGGSAADVDGADGAAGLSGASGAAGQAGATGAAGPAGAPGGSYRWHDANGEQVTPGTDLGVWVDGVYWALDYETGAIRPWQSVRFHEAADCSDAGYVAGLVPRTGAYLRSQFWVRPDWLTAEPVCTLIAQSLDSTCLPLGVAQCMDVVAIDDLDVATKPNAQWLPPLHPEPVQ
jgi:hypothetical protein